MMDCLGCLETLGILEDPGDEPFQINSDFALTPKNHRAFQREFMGVPDIGKTQSLPQSVILGCPAVQSRTTPSVTPSVK